MAFRRLGSRNERTVLRDDNLRGVHLRDGTCRADDGCGTIFSLKLGSAPFIKTVPASGIVGTAVIILGNNLTGATSVTFNGTAALFTVVSSSEITTTVPSGATTGNVLVTTPSGNVEMQREVPGAVAPPGLAATSSPQPHLREGNDMKRLFAATLLALALVGGPVTSRPAAAAYWAD
jgi:uncharacterized protein (TIGR03437 family)